MNSFGFWMALGLVGVLLMPFNFLSGGVNRSILVSGVIIVDGNTVTGSKNLQGNRFGASFDQTSHDGDVSLEDYHHIDPPTSSKASIKHGPIEHGVPSIPRIPKLKPSPPTPSPSTVNNGA